jgi:hypothetical protein
MVMSSNVGKKSLDERMRLRSQAARQTVLLLQKGYATDTGLIGKHTEREVRWGFYP